MKSTNSHELRQFTSKPWWYSVRGGVMIFVGGIVATLCLFVPNVHMLGESFSWLPVTGVIVFILGLLRFLDAFTSKSLQGYLLNMQGGILDTVVGTLILFGISDEPDRLIYLIAGYLFTQGILRCVLWSAVIIDNPISTRITGLVSIILGFLIWYGWPSSTTWFLALSISVDISFRGWALLMLATSLRKESVSDV